MQGNILVDTEWEFLGPNTVKRRAIDCDEKAIQIDQESADVWNDLANSPCLQETWQDSEHAFRKALELDAKSIMHNNDSMLLARRGQTKDASVEFQQAGIIE